MKKLTILSFLFLFSAHLFAAAYQDWNYTGYLDTANLWIKNSSARQYTKKFPLLTAENCNLAIYGKDTSNRAASLASDSTSFAYGYKVGCFYLNSTNSFDTVWQKDVVIDSIVNATANYFANVTDLVTDRTTNQATEVYGLIDTSNGLSLRQVHSFAPNAMPVIMFWVQPLAGCKKASSVKVRLTFTRRSMVQVHTK